MGRGEETFLKKGFLSPPQPPPLSFPRLSYGSTSGRGSAPSRFGGVRPPVIRRKGILFSGCPERAFRVLIRVLTGGNGTLDFLTIRQKSREKDESFSRLSRHTSNACSVSKRSAAHSMPAFRIPYRNKPSPFPSHKKYARRSPRPDFPYTGKPGWGIR